MSDTFAELAPVARAQRVWPLPIKPGQKMPALPAWQRYHFQPGDELKYCGR